MTVIATDGKCVAFDSICTANSYLFGSCDDKAVMASETHVCGATGTVDDCCAFQQWIVRCMKGEAPEKPKLGENYGGIVVDLIAHRCTYYTAGLWPSTVALPFAVGVGDELAIGAMLAGAHPIRAVEIAGMRRLNVGGKTHCLPPLSVV